jgi:hypothetical protein
LAAVQAVAVQILVKALAVVVVQVVRFIEAQRRYRPQLTQSQSAVAVPVARMM